MEQYKCLYKDYNSKRLSPRQLSKMNREIQERNRSKKRIEMFQNSRNISQSGMLIETEVQGQIHLTGIKENIDITNQIESGNVPAPKIIYSTSNPEKRAKDEAYLKRFLEWKENKKLERQRQLEKKAKEKKPFVSVVSGSCETTPATIPLVPIGHHEGFRPPVGLKMPELKAKKTHKSPIKGRESIYVIVPTPPRNTKKEEKSLNKLSTVKKALPPKTYTNIRNSSKTTQNKTPAEGRKITKIKSPPKISTSKAAIQSIERASEKAKSIKKTSSSEQPPSKANLKPKVLKMPPPRPPKSIVMGKQEENKVNSANIALPATKIKQSGAVGKIKSLTSKKINNIKQKKISPLQHANDKNNLNVFKNNKEVEDMIIQTPKDFSTINPFEKFVTSTKLKTFEFNAEQVEGLNSIGNKRANNSSSAKRNILQSTANTTCQEVTVLPNKLEPSENVIKKYNFLIYPESTNTVNVIEDNNAEKKDFLLKGDEKTPTKFGPEERPINYLSPFVSCSRGKVSLKKETEKRNSIYLQNETVNKELFNEVVSSSGGTKNSLEIRRTLEAVRYFRQQLQNEIDRLHKLCDVWEKYKNENLQKIQNANGEDMINVAIGQTRLLTSKKFMQFKGLIDRCESGATGVGAIEDNGSEDTKPITSVDLEGFWSMLGLQIDNLEKRFETLNRWKSNDWVDPDEKKTIIKKNLTKVKKAKSGPAVKAKPNSALQQMLRNMQAEMRKNRIKNEENNNSKLVILTSSKQRRSANSNNSTPRKSIDNSQTSRRMSIVVRDRKYFSPAATVISVSTSNRRTSLKGKSSQDSPKILKQIQKFNEALDSMESSLNLRKSDSNLQSSMILTNNNSINNEGHENKETLGYNSPVTTGRKSILKTPGTAKSRMKNVIFNEKLRVKKFNFLINEDGDVINTAEEESNNTHEEDLAKSHEDKTESEYCSQRTLTLRNRKVRLRPSSEIVIP